MHTLRGLVRFAAGGAAAILLVAARPGRAMDGMSTRNFDVISAATIEEDHLETAIGYRGQWSNRFLDSAKTKVEDRYQSLGLRLTVSPVRNLEFGAATGLSHFSFHSTLPGYPYYSPYPAEGSYSSMLNPSLGAKWRLVNTENINVALITSVMFPLVSKHSAFTGEVGVVVSVDGKNHFNADIELAEGGSTATNYKDSGPKQFVRVDLALGYQASDKIRLFLEETFYNTKHTQFTWDGLTGPLDRQRDCTVGPHIAWRINDTATFKTGIAVTLPGISKNVPMYVGNRTALEFTI